MKASVSVVVATWNRPERLEEALKSIAQQRDDARVEVIVVNDGGVEVSDIVDRWTHLMAIRYVRLDTNSGLARARNEGIRRASGDMLCFLDDDDIMLPGHLRAGAAQLQDEVHAVRTYVAVCDEFVAAGSAPKTEQVKAHYRAAFDERLLMICNFIPVSSVFIRRRSGVSITFDERLSELEDWDLWLRLRKEFGYRFITVPLTTAVYHRVPGFRSMTSSAHESADVALRYRDTFRQITARFPSREQVVIEGRALHDDFYAQLAQARRNGVPVRAFAYERLVECMEGLVSGSLSVEAARKRIGTFVLAP